MIFSKTVLKKFVLLKKTSLKRYQERLTFLKNPIFGLVKFKTHTIEIEIDVLHFCCLIVRLHCVNPNEHEGKLISKILERGISPRSTLLVFVKANDLTQTERETLHISPLQYNQFIWCVFLDIFFHGKDLLNWLRMVHYVYTQKIIINLCSTNNIIQIILNLLRLKVFLTTGSLTYKNLGKNTKYLSL